MKGKRRNGLPKHCSLVIDRHKKRRIRFRAKGVDTYLPYPPVGSDFEKAYAAALAGVTEWRANIGASKTRPGSFDALAVSYYRSPQFQGLRDSTKQTYRRIIENFRENHGKRMMRDLRREHVKAIIGDMADRPQAANRLLSLLKIMLDHGLDNGWIAANPAQGVKGFSKKTKGFHTWTEAEIAAYEARHPEGTNARLALVLLLYTAQRRSDVVAMGWEKTKGKYIEVKQVKTDAELDLFMLPPLPMPSGSFRETNRRSSPRNLGNRSLRPVSGIGSVIAATKLACPIALRTVSARRQRAGWQRAG